MKNQTIKNTIGFVAFVILFVGTTTLAYMPSDFDNSIKISPSIKSDPYYNNGSDYTYEAKTGLVTYDQNDYVDLSNKNKKSNTTNSSTNKNTSDTSSSSSNSNSSITSNSSNSNSTNSENSSNKNVVNSNGVVLKPVTNIDSSNLGASASNSNFVPNSFFGWVLLIFLILIVIILFRLATRSRANTNHAVGAH